MEQIFCTISTESHLSQTLAMLRSLTGYGNWSFHVLVVDAEAHLPDELNGTALQASGPAQWKATEQGARVFKKYKGDKLRWALKPMLVAGLLRAGADQVIYLDNDLYFYNDPSFLFTEMGSGTLLCPHWRIKDPEQNKDWFLVNFKDGVYNAGLVGAGAQGLEAMDWWADACYFACEQKPRKGLWDDQKYLDVIPAAFNHVTILQHRGYNVAYWNLHDMDATVQDGGVLVKGKWPLVCVHYTRDLINCIKKGEAAQLEPHYEKYRVALAEGKAEK